jgi:thiamine transport system substrate-binding protein
MKPEDVMHRSSAHQSSSAQPQRRRCCSLRLFVLVTMALVVVSCGEAGRNDGDPSANRPSPDTDVADAVRGTRLRVVTHDSFNVTDSVIDAFEEQTGITVELVKGGDAVQVVNQAILTRDNPQGDVLFGVDNNLLTRVYDANLFVPYESDALATVDAAVQLDSEHRVTPIDRGDVCLNFDRSYFTDRGVEVPQTLEALTDAQYENLLVVENPSTSTPGLAFLLATIDHFGEDGWQDYWADLEANGVTVAEGWEQAYYDLFSGGSGSGERPLVVSYASSPPVEVTDLTTPADQSPTGVIPSSCYRQIEFAGILAGTEHERAAQLFIDFLLSVDFQNDMPLNMYVYPVNRDATLPEAFSKYSVVVDEPLLLPTDVVGMNRDRWIEEWTRIFGS